MNSGLGSGVKVQAQPTNGNKMMTIYENGRFTDDFIGFDTDFDLEKYRSFSFET